MAVIFSETFTASDDTQVNGYNDWVAKTSAEAADTGLLVKSNRASVTTDGARYAYHSVTGWGLVGTVKVTFARYAGTGKRFLFSGVVGSSSVASYAGFLSNSLNFFLARSDANDTTTTLTVFDGGTQVATDTDISFDPDGSDLVFTLTLAADGSGSLGVVQGASSDSISWTARTWTNGGGQYFGVRLEFNGTDGLGQLTRTLFDSFEVDGTALTLTLAQGAFTLTGVSVALNRAIQLAMSVGSFVLTGIDATLTLFDKWAHFAKNSASFTNKTKNSATFTNKTKNSASFTNITKS